MVPLLKYGDPSKIGRHNCGTLVIRTFLHLVLLGGTKVPPITPLLPLRGMLVEIGKCYAFPNSRKERDNRSLSPSLETPVKPACLRKMLRWARIILAIRAP